MILIMRTDQPEAEIGLYAAASEQLAHTTWLAHRELADTLLSKITDLLATKGKDFTDLTGIVVFQGPGSFTGLRIGIAVANALAYGQQLAIVGAMGDAWIADGIQRIAAGENQKIVLPEYGREANITQPKK